MECGNLVIDRYEGEKIFIGENIELTLFKVSQISKIARLVIRAPKNIKILRGELIEKDQKWNT
jgi:carbon storage regulator CsrA